LIFSLFCCSPSFVPQELTFAIEDVQFSAYEPAIYLISTIESTEENIWEAQQQSFEITHQGNSSFSGTVQIYVLSIPWDQNTLPPLGKVVDSKDLHIIQNQPHTVTMKTPIIQENEDESVHTLIYVEGEGQLEGNIIMKPTVWVHPDKQDLWEYSILSFRY
jgi:hypothetical protein